MSSDVRATAFPDTSSDDHEGALHRIGIMGGTFDPVHIAHLACAEEAYKAFDLDLVLFIPAGNPSFKQGQVHASAEDRFLMVELACASNPHFEVSRMEMDREGVTYTVDTLIALHEQYPDAELFFITGADAIDTIGSWYRADALAELATYIAMPRPGYALDPVDSRRQPGITPFRVEYLDVPLLDISSTMVRERIAAGQPVRYLVPGPVYAYISAKGLYARNREGDVSV